jgi:hypothetical protein
MGGPNAAENSKIAIDDFNDSFSTATNSVVCRSTIFQLTNQRHATDRRSLDRHEQTTGRFD